MYLAIVEPIIGPIIGIDAPSKAPAETIACSNDAEYKFEFKKRCYKVCPQNTTISDNNLLTNKYFCEVICPKDYPFEIIASQECVKSCSITH